jgi:hypothetical protein
MLEISQQSNEPTSQPIAEIAPTPTLNETAEFVEQFTPDIDEAEEPAPTAADVDTDPIVIDRKLSSAEVIEDAMKHLGEHTTNERVAQFNQGKYCLVIHGLTYAKDGSGMWLAMRKRIADQFGLSVSTIRNRINFYKDVCSGKVDIRDFGYRPVKICHEFWLVEMMPDEREAFKAEQQVKADADAKRLREKLEAPSGVDDGGVRRGTAPAPTIFLKLNLACGTKAEKEKMATEYTELALLRGSLELANDIAKFIHDMYEQETAKKKAANPTPRLVLDDDDDVVEAALATVPGVIAATAAVVEVVNHA